MFDHKIVCPECGKDIDCPCCKAAKQYVMDEVLRMQAAKLTGKWGDPKPDE